MNPESRALLAALDERVIGQGYALGPVVDAYVRWKAGLAGVDRPVAAFLLLGPTGVGKTLTVETLATVLHGDPRLLLKIHCAEYRHSHEIARLIGAPPGYIGHKETQPRLSQRRIQEAQSRECPLTLILFDEIEKAHPDLWDLLLGVLDKGELHLGDGSCADLRQAMIFLTSNAGAREAQDAVGFTPQPAQVAEGAARRLFSPEFRNRLTATLVYRALSAAELARVAELEVERCATRLRELRGISLCCSPDAVRHVCQAGQDPAFGARPLRRAVENLIELPLARLILDGQLTAGDEIEARCADNALRFRRRRRASA
jgi:ATP-dependent Clp protease ATP-binding subunit ClpA